MKNEFMLRHDLKATNERGEFGKVAEAIAQAALDNGVTVGELNKIIGGTCGAVNCYPGVPGDTCYEKAFFVSIEGYAKRNYSRGHLSLEQIFAEFNRHFTICPTTRVAVLISDTWSAPIYEHWSPVVKIMADRGIYIEFYLVGPGWQARVALPSLP